MNHPGVFRAIPGAILGFVAGLAIVLGIRTLQGLDPVWNPGVALVLAPFTTTFGWLWGIGAFNPKLSEHGEHHHDDEHAIVAVDGDKHAVVHEEEAGIGELLMSGIWRALSYSLLLLTIFFALATLTNLGLQIVGQSNASTAAFGNSVNLNLFGNEIQTTQMVIFLTFVAVLLVSLIIFGFAIGFLVYQGSNQIKIAQQMSTNGDDHEPPAVVGNARRLVGRTAKGAAKGLKEGLPKALGQ